MIFNWSALKLLSCEFWEKASSLLHRIWLLMINMHLHHVQMYLNQILPHWIVKKLCLHALCIEPTAWECVICTDGRVIHTAHYRNKRHSHHILRRTKLCDHWASASSGSQFKTCQSRSLLTPAMQTLVTLTPPFTDLHQKYH